MIADAGFWLVLAAILSAIAGLLHGAIIIGGPAWYRFFGAGEKMARAAEAGRPYPALITLAIMAVLLTWSAYALSAARLIPELPFLSFALSAITAIYVVRGLALIPLWLSKRAATTKFEIWSSVICLGYGTVHAVALTKVWPTL
jgi:hypothetical protein